MTMAGKLIVIDGTDGAGKATQAALLVDRLKAEQLDVVQLDFPQYEKNFFGKLLRECLDGTYGDFLAIPPKIASVLYAADRFESSNQIKKWLEEGKVVVLDRYVSSNMIHQGSKISDESEMEDFLTWLDTMEHDIFNVPRPDVIIYLDVPAHIRRALMEKDAARRGLDVVESHDGHQLATEECARRITAGVTNWQVVDCTEHGTIRSREAIHEDVYACVSEIITA